MDASAIVALIGVALTVVGAVLGGAWALASRIGGIASDVAALVEKSEAQGKQLDRIESDATSRAQTLSGIRDRLAFLEGQLGVGQ